MKKSIKRGDTIQRDDAPISLICLNSAPSGYCNLLCMHTRVIMSMLHQVQRYVASSSFPRVFTNLLSIRTVRNPTSTSRTVKDTSQVGGHPTIALKVKQQVSFLRNAVSSYRFPHLDGFNSFYSSYSFSHHPDVTPPCTNASPFILPFMSCSLKNPFLQYFYIQKGQDHDCQFNLVLFLVFRLFSLATSRPQSLAFIHHLSVVVFSSSFKRRRMIVVSRKRPTTYEQITKSNI